MHQGGSETRMTTPRERREYGAIVTFQTASGTRFSLHRRGTPTVALCAALADALWFDESAKVDVVCTPDTIYADLQGRTIQDGQAHRYEAQLLARCGLLSFASDDVRRGRAEHWGD